MDGITAGISRIKLRFDNWANDPTRKSAAPDKVTLQSMKSVPPDAAQNVAAEAYISGFTLVGNTYFSYETIGKHEESGSKETETSSSVCDGTSEEGSASLSSGHTQQPTKNDSLLTPVKGNHAVLNDYEDLTISGTPVSTAKKFSHKVDLITPENPDPNRRPKHPDGRHIYKPFELNLNRGLGLDESSSD